MKNDCIMAHRCRFVSTHRHILNLIFVDHFHDDLIASDDFQREQTFIFHIAEHFIGDKDMNASRPIDVYAEFRRVA